uniref:uncharacterized protein LOC122590560 n=1 Tax=Erigeron canadensis TaxID=72917 RepID=UPI001CB982A6|nr:uncharacterized protein LOC122590560 [Erigeron canadensis]
MALIEPQNPNNPHKLNYFTTNEYKSAIKQSIQSLLDSLQKPNPNLSLFTSKFLEFIQSKPDPLLETIWVYSGLSFRPEISQKDENLDQLSALKDLFQSISAYSASCSCIALTAPVIFKLCNVVIGLKDKDFDSKKDKKVRRDIKSFVDVILGYFAVCCEGAKKDDEDSGLITSLNDLVLVWVRGEETENGLKQFFPLLSDEIVNWVSAESGGGGGVGLLAGAVIVETCLLKLCLKFNEGISKHELQNELRTWAVCSLTGFRNFYLFDILVKMLLEPTLPVIFLLNPDDESFLRKILYDVVILPDYSFLHLEKMGHLSVNHIKNNVLARLLVTHEAVELFRKNKDYTKAISYSNAFSGSHLPTLITKLVTSELGTQGSARQLQGSSPVAFLKWMLELENQGLTFSDGFMSKHRDRLVNYSSRMDLDQPSSKVDGGNTANDLLFFIDNKGDDDDEDDKIDDSMNDAFVTAARAMQSDEGGKKRKETRVDKKKDRVKFQRYNLVDHSSSKSGKKTRLINEDDLGGASEVEDPDSDEDVA